MNYGRIVPRFPEIFGEPFPYEHPWAGTVNTRGWEVEPSKKVHLLTGPDCTACKRGVPKCPTSNTRLTKDWRRATCARCIRRGIHDDPAAWEMARAIWKHLAGGKKRHDEGFKLWRAIGWWRSVGAQAHWLAYYLNDYFIINETQAHGPKENKRRSKARAAKRSRA